MLQIKNLSKSYGAKKAVSNLSFVVEDGDMNAIFTEIQKTIEMCWLTMGLKI